MTFDQARSPWGAREVHNDDMVEVRALGPIEAVVAGTPADLGAPKQRALLTLLVSRVGQPVSVDVLLEELWSGHPPPSAVTSLQAYVANLRRVLEPARAPRTPAKVLCTHGKGYLLDGTVVNVDVRRFEERAAAGWRAWEQGDPKLALSEFESGLALWRGQAYAEMPAASHVLPEAARLRELRLSMVEGRCAALLAVGAHEVAVAELEAFMQAHPLREYGCELLSLALYRAGRQAEALAVLRTNQKRLAEELGIDPRPALQHLEREILNQDPTLDWRPAAPAVLTAAAVPAVAPLAPITRPVVLLAPTAVPCPSTVRPGIGMAAAPPGIDAAALRIFIGREAELRVLAGALDEAALGRGRVVAVSGEPGAGKTGLLQRFAAQAGVPVLWGACPENLATPPLWPWQQVLRAAAASRPHCAVPEPVAELLDGEVYQGATEAEDAATTMRRFEAIVHYLTRASRGGPLVLVLDHMHRADSGSLRLLAHLAESVAASHLLVLAAYRSDEAVAVAETSAALARAEMARVELDGLGVEDIRELARAMVHRELGCSDAAELRARTAGNPFFLRELIKLAADRGQPELPHRAPVPAPVRDVLLRRVGQLPKPAADLLLVASVAGRQFSVDAVAEAAVLEVDAALGLMERVEAAGLLVEDSSRLGWFRFTHALTAEVLDETVGRLRRARLLLRLDSAGGAAGRLTREHGLVPSPQIRELIDEN